MWERSEGTMGTQHHVGKGKWAEMMMWEKLDEEAKKQLMMRKLDERIMKKEFKIEYLQHKVKTLKNDEGVDGQAINVDRLGGHAGDYLDREATICNEIAARLRFFFAFAKVIRAALQFQANPSPW